MRKTRKKRRWKINLRKKNCNKEAKGLLRDRPFSERIAMKLFRQNLILWRKKKCKLLFLRWKRGAICLYLNQCMKVCANVKYVKRFVFICLKWPHISEGTSYQWKKTIIDVLRMRCIQVRNFTMTILFSFMHSKIDFYAYNL